MAAKGGKATLQHGPSPAVVQALNQYEKQRTDAALQGVLRLVEEGTHGSAACLAAVKALLLHAAQAAGQQRSAAGEAAVAHLLLQAIEASVHGALRYRSIQLLEACCHLMATCRGNKHHLERRGDVLFLLQNGVNCDWWQKEKLEASPLLPLQQLLADRDTPRSHQWWNNVTFADWVHPAAEAVGSSTFPWECPRPYAHLGDYQEVVHEHASRLQHTMLKEMLLGQLHKMPAETMGQASVKEMQRRCEQDPEVSKLLQERLARSHLLPTVMAAELRKKLGIKSEADREVTLLVSKAAEKAQRRREQPTAESRSRALQRKRREERDARELAEAHSRAKVVADFLRLQLERAGREGGAAADPLAVFCQVARMPWQQLQEQLSLLPGATKEPDSGPDAEGKAKEKEIFEVYEQIQVAAKLYTISRELPQVPPALYRSAGTYSNRYSTDNQLHLSYLVAWCLPSKTEEILGGLQDMAGMKDIITACEQLRCAANALLPSLELLAELGSELRDEEWRGLPVQVLRSCEIEPPRTSLEASKLEHIPVLAHPPIPRAEQLPPPPATLADLRELCGLLPLDAAPELSTQRGQAAAMSGSQCSGGSDVGRQQQHGSSTPDLFDEPDVGCGLGWAQQQEGPPLPHQQLQWLWSADATAEDEEDILEILGPRQQQQQQQPAASTAAAAAAAGGQSQQLQTMPGRRRLRRRLSSGGGSSDDRSSDATRSRGGDASSSISSSIDWRSGDSRPGSGLILEDSDDTASDAETAEGRSASTQFDRLGGLGRASSSSSLASQELWPPEVLGAEVGGDWGLQHSDAARSHSASQYGSNSGPNSSRSSERHSMTAATWQQRVDSAKRQLNVFLQQQNSTRRALRGLFCPPHHLADVPIQVPPKFAKVPILRLAYLALDGSLRPALLGSWLLRGLEQEEADAQEHAIDIQAFDPDESLGCGGAGALAHLEAFWRSPQPLLELVGQLEPADVAQRVDAVMKEQLSSLLRQEALKLLPDADSEEMDEVRLSVQLDNSSRVLRAMLCGGEELLSGAQACLEGAPGAGTQAAEALGAHVGQYKHILAAHVLRGLRLLRDTRRLTRPVWRAVLGLLSQLNNKLAPSDLTRLSQEFDAAHAEVLATFQALKRLLDFSEKDWQLLSPDAGHLNSSDALRRQEVSVAFEACQKSTSEGRAYIAAHLRYEAAFRRWRAADAALHPSSQKDWVCGSGQSEHGDHLSWHSTCNDDGRATAWLHSLSVLPLGPLELLHTFVATQVALGFGRVSDIDPSLKGSLLQAQALAVLQPCPSEPSPSGEAAETEPCWELTLRADSLAAALGAGPASSTDQLVASFANFAAGLRPADERQGAAAGATAVAAPAEQTGGSAAGRGEGRSKRTGPTRAPSGALPNPPGSAAQDAAGDVPAGSLVLDNSFERQEAVYQQIAAAAQRLFTLMMGAGGLSHVVRAVVELWKTVTADESVLANSCYRLTQRRGLDHKEMDLLRQAGGAVLELYCLVDRAANLCLAVTKALQLGASKRLCNALQAARQLQADGLAIDPLELNGQRPTSPTDLETMLLESQKDAKDVQEELEDLLKSSGRDLKAWLRAEEQKEVCAVARPLLHLFEALGEYGHKRFEIPPAERQRLTQAAARSLVRLVDLPDGDPQFSFCATFANEEADQLLVLQAECYCAALRLLGSTWACHGGATLPLDNAARIMLRYLLPPVWKKEVDSVEEERRIAAQAALVEEEEELAAAAAVAAAKRKGKKKKSKKAAAADDEGRHATAAIEDGREALAQGDSEQAAEESLEDLAVLLGRKQPMPPAQQLTAQQATAAQPAAAAATAQEQPQQGRRRKGRKKGGASATAAEAAEAEVEEELPAGYLRMLAAMHADEQLTPAAEQQQQQSEKLSPELLQISGAINSNEAAWQQQAQQPEAQQQGQQPPPLPPPLAPRRAQLAAAPLPVPAVQQPPTPPQLQQIGAVGVQGSVSEPDHSLEAQLAAASAFDWTAIEGTEAESSWQSSNIAAPAAPDWQDAAETSQQAHQTRTAGTKQQAAVPAAGPASPARRSVDRSKPRVVDWDGRWICKCGRERKVREGCKPCGFSAPCRDYLKGLCPYLGACNYPHLQFDLPAEGPPPGSKALICPPHAQQLPKSTVPKPQHDERLARVVSWRGQYICPCGVRRHMQHACEQCGYGPVCRDWVRGRCEFGASCRFSHPLFDLAGAPSVPAEERVVVGRLVDLPQWRPPTGDSSASAAGPSRPGTATAAQQRPQSGSNAQAVLLSAPPAAVAAVCSQFGVGAEELEALLGPDVLQDALEQVQLQEAERVSMQTSSGTAVPTAPGAASAVPPPPPPPRPLSAAPVAAAAQHSDSALAASAASQASSDSAPAESSSLGSMRIVNSEGSWVCLCGFLNLGNRSRCKARGCSQLAPCRKWMVGECTAANCQFPHPPFDPAGNWQLLRNGKPKAMMWEGCPLLEAPQQAAASPPEAPAEEDGDLSALLQTLGISDISAGGWGEAEQGGGSEAALASSLSAMATPGLRNEAGEYNCFLNAIIQCLWRCADFRQQVAAWGPAVCGHDRVVSALYSLFVAFAAEEQQRQQFGPLQDSTARRGLVNPSELRQALSALPGPQQYCVGEMNDAGEVLLTIYERVMELLGQEDGPVQRVFGLKVAEHVQCHACGKITQQNSYTQFYQNIAAANLQAVRELSLQSESMLTITRLLDQQTMKTCDQDVGGCGLRNSVRHTLLRPPRVFTLQLAWKSHCLEPHVIAATLAALDETVNLGDFYEGVPPGTPPYVLRSMVCYYGAHYLAFVWADDCCAWLLFDDVRVSRVGSLANVLHKCEAGRIQPCVLFYEALA